MNLFEIKEEYLAVLEAAEDPTVDPQMVADMMESIQADFTDKVEAYIQVIKQIGFDVEALRGIVSTARGKIAALEAHQERLLKNLQSAMVETGQRKVRTPLFTTWIQKNPETVKMVEGKEVPERFLVPQPPKVDTAGILKALKAGETFDFAVKVQTEGVRIR